MILHLYTSKTLKDTDDIQLVKQTGYYDKLSNSVHKFYITLNNEDCGGVCGFEGEDKDVFFDYDFDDFLVDILEDKMKASFVSCEEDRYDYYHDRQNYHCILKIDVDEKIIEKEVNRLRKEKEKQDEINMKNFRINSTKQMLSKDKISKPIAFCEDYWDKDSFEIGYDDARRKYSGTFACPFDNNVITGSLHHSNDLGWGCYYRCKLHSINKSPHHKELLLNRHLDNLNNDVYDLKKLSKKSKTKALLDHDELIELEDVLKKVRKEERKKEKIEEQYRKKYLVKVNGCSPEIFKDFKKLSESCNLTRFDDFEFNEDHIIYNYVDYDFCEEQTEINAENIIFSIMPSMDNKFYQIRLGNGCCVVIDEPITEDNKEHLKDFYEKCKTYKSKYPTYFI